jgi:hypothetical protein
MSLADIRSGLGDNLGTISAIRVYEEVPDNPALPCAVVELQEVSYDQSFQRGLTDYTFIIYLIVVRSTERRAQQKLDQFIDAGARSVKSAIEADKSLGGSAFDVRVTELRDIGETTIGDIQYMAAKFAVTVLAE